jgi:hypothetical protein
MIFEMLSNILKSIREVRVVHYLGKVQAEIVAMTGMSYQQSRELVLNLRRTHLEGAHASHVPPKDAAVLALRTLADESGGTALDFPESDDRKWVLPCLMRCFRSANAVFSWEYKAIVEALINPKIWKALHAPDALPRMSYSTLRIPSDNLEML